MADSNQVSTLALALIAVAGGVGTVLGAGLALLGDARASNRSASMEHNQWLRRTRYEAYADLLYWADTFSNAQTDVDHPVATLSKQAVNQAQDGLQRWRQALQRALMVSDVHGQGVLYVFALEFTSNMHASDAHQLIREPAMNKARAALSPYLLAVTPRDKGATQFMAEVERMMKGRPEKTTKTDTGPPEHSGLS